MTPLARLGSFLRTVRLRASGITIASGCVLAPGVQARRGIRSGQPGTVSLAAGCRLESGALVEAWGGKISLGENVFLGPYTVIYGHGGVEIGADTLVSMHCRILSSNHTIPPPEKHIRWEPDVLRPTHIGRDVWLGAGTTILGGVTIGDGCVIGAGAVVTSDLPPYSIAYGVPATVRGSRRNP